MYKSSNFRRPQQASDAPTSKYSAQINQLQELFPNWTPEDLQSVLSEVNGDVQLAATHITEGRVQQWDSVTHKKDKKAITPSNSQSKDLGNRERGEFRGARGGRGGRGGPGRGGAARGAFARGGHHETNGRHAKPAASQSTDSVSASTKPADATAPDAAATDSAPTPADATTSTDSAADASPWGTPAPSSTALESSTPSAWGATAPTNGVASHPSAPSQVPVSAKTATKTPATSKMSWAQIARPQEKPTPPPPASAPAAPVPVAPTPAPARQEPIPQRAPTPPPEPVEEPLQTGWEEPTTVQAPTWDDEPSSKPPTSAWTTTQEPLAAEESKPKEEETVASPPQPEPVPVLSALPAQLQQKTEPAAPAPQKPLTPAAHTRPTSSAAHRHSAKFKTDQAVVMPSGSFGTVEKIGMQFGSLGLGGDEVDETPAPVSEAPAPASVVEAPTPAAAQSALHISTPAPEPSAPVTVAQPTPNGTASSLLQQVLPQQQQQHPIPSLAAVSQTQQPAAPLSQQSAQPAPSAASSISPYSHQPSQTSAVQQQQPSHAGHHAPHQHATHQTPLHSQQHHYVQHGLPTHAETAQGQQQPHSAQSPQGQQQQNVAHSSFFRQQEAQAPYFHAPTPPVPSTQSQESPYGSFGQLGGQLGANQIAHQTQANHLSGFNQGEYGYADNQRTFYDSYSGGPGFNNRNVLGHEDIKGLPGAPQQTHSAPGLAPSNSQPSQQLPQSAQSGTQSQPGGQGPQQYPPPLPYYYPFPQNQYYGAPYNSGYSVPQPFVKYPTVFQGPPGPQSAPSPAAKQGPSAVQPQSPYGQGLYGQQHPSNAYDEIGYQQHSQHSHGHSVSSIPSNEYSKHQQLYGSSTQGMQGFMGLGQSAGPTPNSQLGQRGGTGGSPEASYKPYGTNVGVKDVSSGVGVGQGGVGQGPQGRGGVQPQQQGSFYSAQRFASSAAGAPPAAQNQHQQPQGQGPQAHLGYPQGASEVNGFYSYQQGQGGQRYWQ